MASACWTYAYKAATSTPWWMTFCYDTENARFSTCTVEGMPARRAFRSGWGAAGCRVVGSECVVGWRAWESVSEPYS